MSNHSVKCDILLDVINSQNFIDNINRLPNEDWRDLCKECRLAEGELNDDYKCFQYKGCVQLRARREEMRIEDEEFDENIGVEIEK